MITATLILRNLFTPARRIQDSLPVLSDIRALLLWLRSSNTLLNTLFTAIEESLGGRLPSVDHVNLECHLDAHKELKYERAN